MRTVSAYFDTYSEATDAVTRLVAAGVPAAEISILARDPDGTLAERHRLEEDASEAGEGFEQGAGVGAVLGGTGGMLIGMGALAVPGVGPVLLGGWIAAAALGAAAGAILGGATGGLIGAMVHAGIPEEDARTYATRLEEGGAVVTAMVSDEFYPSAAAIMARATAIDSVPEAPGPIDETWLDFRDGTRTA